MAEERIFHLLRNLNLNSDKFAGDFPRLNPDFVEDVSKSLASILADTDKKGSSRIGCIQFLKRICATDEGHNNINESNYETFIQASPLAETRDDLDVYKFKREIDKSRDLGQQKSVLDEAMDFYNFRMQLHKKRMDRFEFINMCNQKTFPDLDYTPSRKLENYSENVTILSGFRSSNSVAQDLNTTASPVETVLKRRSDIKFAYAVLNLDSKQKKTVIDNLLFELECRKPLKDFEIEFLKYLFKTEVNFRETLMDSHSFLLEIPIVEICTKLIDTDYHFEEDQRFALIKDCFNLSPRLKSKIIRIFYDLFALGNYDDVFLKPIMVLNKK